LGGIAPKGDPCSACFTLRGTALTSPTGGGCSVGIVRSRIKATESVSEHFLNVGRGSEGTALQLLTSAVDRSEQLHAPASLTLGIKATVHTE
jgi:hypothetical protein